MIRRYFLSFIALVFCVGMIAGCGSNAPEFDPSKAPPATQEDVDAYESYSQETSEEYTPPEE